MVGEWIDIEGRLNNWAEGIEKKYNLPPLAKGFIAATLIFCVGAMAIVGSIQDGISGDITTLLIKSALDFVTAMILASVLGIGVIFSAQLFNRPSISIHSPTITPMTKDIMIKRSSDVNKSPLSMVKKSFKNHPSDRAVSPKPNATITPFCMRSGKPFLKITPIKVAMIIAAALINVPINTSMMTQYFHYKANSLKKEKHTP
jgi:hypothetical protein